jgi:hypothetical protein
VPPARDRATDLKHPVRPRLRPRHASMLHASSDDVLAGVLDGAAADWEPHRAVPVVVNPLLVIIEVVDLPLDEVPILRMLARVADLAQFLEELLTLPIKEHVFPTFEMLPVPRSLFAIQVLADVRDMFASMIEVQNKGAVLGGDLNEAIPDPLRSKSYVNIGFWWGAKLKDPEKVLEGDGDKMRHVKIRTPGDLKRNVQVPLIRQSAEANQKLGDPTKTKA